MAGPRDTRFCHPSGTISKVCDWIQLYACFNNICLFVISNSYYKLNARTVTIYYYETLSLKPDLSNIFITTLSKINDISCKFRLTAQTLGSIMAQGE